MEVNLEKEEAKNEQIQESSEQVSERDAIIQELVTHLQQQYQSLLESAKVICIRRNQYLQELKDKDKKMASEKVRLCKQTKTDCETLLKIKQDPSLPVPSFHYETLKTEEKIENQELSDSEIEFHIIECTDIKEPNHNLYLYMPFNYVPEKSILQTPKKSGKHLKFSHRQKFNFQRKKGFTYNCEKKRLYIELWQINWFFFHKSIGKAEIRLKPLLEQSVIHETLDIKSGRKVLGQVEVEIKIRRPLSQDEIKVTEEQILVLETEQDSKPVTPTKNQNSTVEKTTSNAAPSPTPTTNSNQSTPKPKVSPQKENPAPSSVETSTESELEEYLNVDNIISNDVLEYELQLVQNKIEQLGQKKQKVPEEMEDRKMQIELKLNVLGAQVQSGIITQEAYLGQLKERIGKDKSLAVRLSKAGKKQDALQILQRVKIMKKELVDSLEE